MYFKRLFFCILSILCTMGAVAVLKPQFRSLTADNGLSDLVVNAIYKDSEGFIWLGTGAALDRFDGVRIKHYTIDAPESGTTGRRSVNSIRETPDRTLWVGTSDGLFSLSADGTSVNRSLQEDITAGVNSLLAVADTLYIGTDRGLYVYNTATAEINQVLPSRDVMSRNNVVYDIAATPGNSSVLWLATPAGLMLSDASGQRLELERYPDREELTVNDIIILDNTIYIATDGNGILTFDINNQQYSRYLDLGSNVITDLTEGPDGLLYASTDGSGIHAISTRRRKVIATMNRSNVLRSNSVYSMLIDRNGSVWVGYYQGGLDYMLFQRDLVETFAAEGLLNTAGMTVRALGIHGTEKLIGTREGLYYIDPARGVSLHFSTPYDMRASMVFSILRDAATGQYWVGTYGGGIYLFDPSTLQLIDYAPAIGLSNANIFIITSDPKGNIWVGTSRGVHCYRDGKEIMSFTEQNSRIPRGNVYEIYFDSAGRGWICTENGMCVYDNGEIRDDCFPQGFINRDKIRDVFEDSRRNIWFMPDRGAVVRANLELTKWATVAVDPKTENPGAGFITEDKEGRMWFGTNDGLSYLDKSGVVRPLSYADGIPSPIFTMMTPVTDADGNLYLGNSGGLLVLDVDRLTDLPEFTQKPAVTDIIANGRSVMNTDPRRASETEGARVAQLAGNMRNITIQFSDMIYTSPEQALFEYMLEGVDTEWKSIAGKSEVSYFELSSGTYRFHLRRTGVADSETVTEFTIDRLINYPLLIMSVLLFAITALAGVLLYRHRKALMALRQKPVPEDAAVQAQASEAAEKYKTTRISDEECRRILSRLDKLMKNDRPYTNPELKIADLAKLIDVPAHSLSFLFNQYLEKSYYDYVNEYRVKEFKVLIDAGGNTRYTLTAMSEMCGFSSRASFFRHFKRLTGITPNEYIKQKEEVPG